MKVTRVDNYRLIECNDKEKKLIKETIQLLTRMRERVDIELEDENVESVYLEDELDNMLYRLSDATESLV